MAQYLKISYPEVKPRRNGLKEAITYIGKCYGKLANKSGCTDKEYFKSGKKVVAKRCGRFCWSAVSCMVTTKKVKGSNARQWCYHKRIYGKAYRIIVNMLFKSPPCDKEYVAKLLNGLYQDVCDNNKNGLEIKRLCSNALMFWQKEMLGLRQGNQEFPEDVRTAAGKILREIADVDRPLP
jgi:hypothetical protein